MAIIISQSVRYLSWIRLSTEPSNSKSSYIPAVCTSNTSPPQGPTAASYSSLNTKHQPCMFCRAKFEYWGGGGRCPVRQSDDLSSWTAPSYCSTVLMTLFSYDEWSYYRHCQRGRAPYSRQFIGSSRGWGGCTAPHFRTHRLSPSPCHCTSESGCRNLVLRANIDFFGKIASWRNFSCYDY